MNINFPPVDDSFIKNMVRSGFYSNATELVRDAVRRMRELDAGKADRLRAALQKGEDDIAAGRVHEYTDTFFDDIIKEIDEAEPGSIEIDPDTMP